MLTESRTHDEIFQAWKGKYPEYSSWREYWDVYLRRQTALYESLGLISICLARETKIPVGGVKWKKRSVEHRLTYENAYRLLDEGMNLGVNLKASKPPLIVADIDDRKIPDALTPFVDQTMSAITPHGYHIYFEYDMPEYPLEDVRIAFQGKSGFRGGPKGVAYTVLPPSHILIQECPKPKYYEWLPDGEPSISPLMKFSELLRSLS